MSCRRYGARPTIALWLVIAITDTMLLVTWIGVERVLLALAAVATVAVAVAGLWSLRRGVHAEDRTPAAMPAGVRERA